MADHWRTIVSALGEAEPAMLPDATTDENPTRVDQETDLGGIVDKVVADLSHRSLVVLVSDMLDDPSAVERGFARLNHRRHDLIAFQVLDHAELTFPYRASAEFVGLEGEGTLPLEPSSLRQAYLEALNSHTGRLVDAAHRYGFDHVLVDTAKPLGPLLSKFLARRGTKIGKTRMVRR